jgi:hypothetical protein
MTHPLDGARLKVARAKDHLDALKDEVGRHLRSKSFQAPVKKNNDMATVVSPVIRVEPTGHLGCVLGDCLCNLRASLDYIAWQLGTKAARGKLTEGQKRRVSFPVASDPKEYRRSDGAANHLGTVCGVPAPAMIEIESVQPYHAGYGSLGLLSVLVNDGKHRLPVLTIASVGVNELKALVEVCDGGRVIAEATAGGDISFTLGRATPGSPPRRTREVKVDCQPALAVSISNPLVPQMPVDLLLGRIYKCVASIIPRFDPFF